MKLACIPRPNRRGVATLICLLILVGLALLASGLLIITTTDIYVARNDAYAKEALFAAEAGLHHAERIMRNDLKGIDAIETMYKAGYDTECFKYNNEYIGHKFTDGVAWVEKEFDLNGDKTRKYQLFVENDEIDTNGNPDTDENNNSFLIRSVGYSAMGSRAILEASYYVESAGYHYDQAGGGSGGITDVKQ